ncbi:MAG: hypothetical protein AAGA54_33010 [Myxococcota bacterium]
MHARSAFVTLLTLFAAWALPKIARADKNPERFETASREGLTLDVRMLSGAALHGPDGFTPVTRISYSPGGAVAERFVLGADLGVTAWWEDKKGSFHGDTFGKLFITKGLFARASGGIASHTYVAGVRKAALGGSLGGGWELPLGKNGFMALNGEYDVRVRSDWFLVRTVLVGFSIGAYKKRR